MNADVKAQGPDAFGAGLRVASYNIRKALGLDWRRNGNRVLDVLAEIDADIVVLQEADKRLGSRPGVLPEEKLKDELGYEFAQFEPLSDSHGWHGNAILYRRSRFGPPAALRKINLPSLEPRGAVSMRIESPSLEIIGVHLGLTPRSRAHQLRALAAQTCRSAHAVIIAGDFNTSMPNKRIEAFFGGAVTSHTPGPSFHAALPFASLDRFVLLNFMGEAKAHVHSSELACRASDHLPIVIDLKRAGDAASAAASERAHHA